MVDQKCKELMKNEKYPELEAYCKEKLNIKEDEGYHFIYSLALAGNKKIEKAELNLVKLINYSKKPIFLISLGLIRFLIGKEKEGRENISEAIKIDENVPELLFAFRVAMKFNDFEDAERAIRKAINKNKKVSLEEIESMYEELSLKANENDRKLYVSIMSFLKTAFSD